jgi:hypothetical protein
MAVISVNSISGINSITAQSGALNFYTAAGNNLPISAGTLNVGTGASISSPATNVLALGTNNTEAIRISSTGAVGVGTNDPGSTKMLVYGNGNVLRLGDFTNTHDLRFTGPNNWDLQLDTTNDKFNIRRNSSTFSTIDSNGKIGIGTTNISLGKLHIEGTVFARQGSSSILFSEYNNGSVLWMDGSDGDMSGGDYWGIYAQSASQWGVNHAGGANILNITSSDSLVFTSSSLCVATSTIKQKLTVNGDIGIYKGGGQTRIFTVKGGNGTFSTLTITVNQYDFGCFVYDLKVHGYAGSYLHYAGGAYENGGIYNPATTIAQKSASATFTGPTWVSGHTWRITVNWSNAWVHPVAEFSVSGGGNFQASESDITMVWS